MRYFNVVSTGMRDDRIDFVRCVSNYMIVLLHAWAAFQYVEQSGAEYFFWTAICTHLSWIALPTIFVVSGYLLFFKYDIPTSQRKLVVE